MGRIFPRIAVAILVGASIAAPPEGAEDMIRALLARELKAERLPEAERVIGEAATREPAKVRWLFGQGLVAQAKGEKTRARDLMGQVVEREPQNADHQAHYAIAIFEAIGDEGMFGKMTWGRKGKAALDRAVEIDPNHVLAHEGLAQYYAEAPAIAGGSMSKAEEQGRLLLAIPGRRGEFRGRLVLASIAEEKKDWTEMSRQFELAETAEGEGARPALAFTLHALALLREAHDPKAALAVAERYLKIAEPDDTTAVFLLAEAERELGNCKPAVENYEKVLAAKPDAVNSRFGVAKCLEKLGDSQRSASNYEEFARRFPKDPRASEAQSAAKRLRAGGSR